MGRAKVASVTARPQARHTLCPNFCLFVLFIFKVSLSRSTLHTVQSICLTVYLSNGPIRTQIVSLCRQECTKGWGKKPQLCIFSQGKSAHIRSACGVGARVRFQTGWRSEELGCYSKHPDMCIHGLIRDGIGMFASAPLASKDCLSL